MPDQIPGIPYDNYSAFSLLKLIRDMTADNLACPICEFTLPLHKSTCNLKWHLDKLEAEVLYDATKGKIER